MTCLFDVMLGALFTRALNQGAEDAEEFAHAVALVITTTLQPPERRPQGGQTQMTEPMRMQRSSRDPSETRQRLERWLADTLGSGSSPTVSDLAGTDANGMSSDTMLFRATWSGEDGHHDERLVARVAPDAADVPVFPTYDLQGQFEVIRAVAELTEVPVPRAWWCENSPVAMGAPFFVMSRVDGEVPPDVMPYTFGDNWLFDATPGATTPTADHDRRGDRRPARHQRPDERVRLPGAQDASGDTHLRRHVANTRAWYEMVKREGTPSPLIERGFEWLEANWPAHESDPVLSWGDSRIGNVLYQDFAPVALLDWEMAGLGPAELDIGWIVYAHHVFQSLAAMLDLPGMPGFMTPADVAAQYESLTGHAVRDLRFFMVYAAVQWGIVFLRTGSRQAHFGEREMPAQPEDLIHNRTPPGVVARRRRRNLRSAMPVPLDEYPIHQTPRCRCATSTPATATSTTAATSTPTTAPARSS